MNLAWWPRCLPCKHEVMSLITDTKKFFGARDLAQPQKHLACMRSQVRSPEPKTKKKRILENVTSRSLILGLFPAASSQPLVYKNYLCGLPIAKSYLKNKHAVTWLLVQVEVRVIMSHPIRLNYAVSEISCFFPQNIGHMASSVPFPSV